MPWGERAIDLRVAQKFGDLGTDAVKRRKQFEQENSRLKKLVVERDPEEPVLIRAESFNQDKWAIAA